MPIMFNALLRAAGLDPDDTRLLRHQDKRADRGRTPYELWRDDRSAFEFYQSLQRVEGRSKFKAKCWASFVGTRDGGTLFVGLYSVKHLGPLKEDRPLPHMEGVAEAGSYDQYELTLQEALSDLSGKLQIAWGEGTRAWVQYASRQDKPVVEVRAEFREDDFPGFMEFLSPLSRIEGLPKGWIDVLRACRGIYLLTCPKTKEQYVGSATGEEGFWQRWMDYVRTGHGGDLALRSRDPSDYQVSILEVAGTANSTDDIMKMEGRWQRKLQSRAMGLNRNLAKR